jgi:hypothetical protein
MKRLLIASFICSCVVNGYGMQQAQQAQHAWSTLTANQRFNQFVESGEHLTAPHGNVWIQACSMRTCLLYKTTYANIST